MMETFKKIIVTGDILRINVNGGSSQDINIRWLYHLIRPVLEMLSSFPVEPLYHDTGSKGCLSTELYRINGQPVSLEGWVSMYAKQPTARDMAVIYAQFEESLVIAFELPEFMRKAFDQMEIPYVDFTIHPARFLDDLLFGVRSNIQGLSEALRPWVICEEEIRMAAGLAMSMMTRLPRLEKCADARDIALFAGQTTDDKVLIRNGRILQAEDFMQAFADISVKHEKVLVKPHPLVKHNPIVTALTRLFPNAIEVDANFYHLMAQENISHVYSITSSTSIEAAYFDKKGVHLAPYPYAFSDTSAIGGSFLQVGPEIYSLSFWQAILNVIGIETCPVPTINMKHERNRMRRSLRNFWGANIFEFNG